MYRKQLIGTHNSMSYLPVAKWYFRPFNFIAKCQSKDIKQQLALGINVVDIRIRKNRKCCWVFAHGLIEYKGNVEDTIHYISKYAKSNSVDIYYRFILEISDTDKTQTDNFTSYIHYLQGKYDIKDTYIIDVRRKSDWALLSTCTYKNIEQYVSSMDNFIFNFKIHIPIVYSIFKNKNKFKKVMLDKTNALFDFL